MRNDPPCIKGENAPDWLVITGPHYRTRAHSTTEYAEPDPVKFAKRQAANATAHAISIARKESARADRKRIHKERLAAEAAMRGRVSRRRKIERNFKIEVTSRTRTSRTMAKKRRVMETT